VGERIDNWYRGPRKAVWASPDVSTALSFLTGRERTDSLGPAAHIVINLHRQRLPGALTTVVGESPDRI